MLIGQDFEKIEFELFGWELLEPNAFIGDTILAFLAFFLAFRLRKITKKHNFYRYWFLFFICFGLGFFIGGLGHLFWNYWGVEGKYFSWYSGLFSSLFVEHAMISIHQNKRERRVFETISRLKFVYAFLALTFLIMTRDFTTDVSAGLVIPSINSTIGMVLAIGILPFYYQRNLKMRFHYFWMSLIVLLPISFLQHLKINFAQWMDRNDISHILLLIALLLYFAGIAVYRRAASTKLS